MPLTQRRFGVEIEHGNPRMRYEAVHKRLKAAKFPTGVRQLGLGPPTVYSTTADGSGVEVRTPALKGRAGLEELRAVMEFLKNIGGYTGAADGMHVHHEAWDYLNNREAILGLTDSWIANRSITHKFVDKRRHTSVHCAGVAKNNIERAVKRPAGSRVDFPRGDLNFGSLIGHGTIEIRLHEGTLDPARASSWVVFGQAFIEKVLKEGQFGKQKSPKALLEWLGIADEYARTLYRRSSGVLSW